MLRRTTRRLCTTFVTKNEEETERLGAKFANWFLRNDKGNTRILCLNGDVGSGKSVFCRGFVRQIIGKDEDVPSPTYLLVNEYAKNETKVLHADLYRLSEGSNFDVLGIPFLGGQSQRNLCLIEWPERLGRDRKIRSRLDMFFEHDASYDPCSADSTEQTRMIRVDTTSNASSNWRRELVDQIVI